MNAPTENPFADDPVESDALNPYGPASDTSYNPVYERTLFPRTRTIVSLSVFCFLWAALGELVYWTSFTFSFLPLALISGILAVSALWLGNRDLAAIRAGVMSSESRTWIRASVAASAIALMMTVGRILYVMLVFQFG